MRFKYIYAAIAAVPVSLLAFSTGPLIKRTGSIDGGVDCSACHRTFGAANSDPRGSVRIENLQPYVPGVPQNLRLTVSHPDAARWGFQLTARFVNGGASLKAGTLTPANEETKVLCDNGTSSGSPGPCAANQLEWLEHANAPRGAVGAGHTFEFQWTPPGEENGDIMFYFAGNAADGNNSSSNDHIYTSSARSSLSPEATCPDAARPQIRAAANAGSHSASFSSNSMVEIYGLSFQPGDRSRAVGPGDMVAGAFPKSLACVAVEIAGARIPITYVSPNQINAQAPTLAAGGPVTVVAIANPGKSNELRSNPATVLLQQPAPAFFTLGASRSIAAQFAGTADVVADPSLSDGARPAKPGDAITLYATGCGATNPAFQAGEVTSKEAPLAVPFTLSIGGQMLAASDILYAGLSPNSISGLYQFNVRIPASAPDGDLPVVLTTMSGATTQPGATIPVKQ